MTKKERIDYLDMAKGIGMLLVVIGHVSYVSEPVRQYIVAFHMPLFFLLSGILIRYKGEENSSFKETVRKRAKKLLIPYAIFSVLYFVMEGTRLVVKDLDEWDTLLRQLWQSVCMQGVSTLWFLPALFFSEVIFIWIRKHAGHIQTIVNLLIIMTAMHFINDSVKFYFAIHGSFGCLLVFDVLSMLIRSFFCAGLVGIGYYLGMLLLDKRMPGVSESILGIFLLLGVGFIAKYNPGVDLRSVILGKPIWFLLGGVTGTVGVILMCRVISRLPMKPVQCIFEYFGRNSLLIMVTHIEFRVLYLAITLATLLSPVHNNTLFCIFIVLFVFLIEVVVIEVVNRFFSLFAKKR